MVEDITPHQSFEEKKNLEVDFSNLLEQSERVTTKYFNLFEYWLNPESNLVPESDLDPDYQEINLKYTKETLTDILEMEKISDDAIFDKYNRMNYAIVQRRKFLFQERNRKISQIWAKVGIDRYSQEPHERFEEPEEELIDFNQIDYSKYEVQMELEYLELERFNVAEDQLYAPYQQVLESSHQRICEIIDKNLISYISELDQAFQPINELIRQVDQQALEGIKEKILPKMLETLEIEGQFDSEKLKKLKEALDTSENIDPDEYAELLHTNAGKDIYHLIQLISNGEPQRWVENISDYYYQQQTNKIVSGELSHKIQGFIDFDSPRMSLFFKQFESHNPQKIFERVTDNSVNSIYSRVLYWKALTEIGGLNQLSRSDFDINELSSQISSDLAWKVISTKDNSRRKNAIRSLEFYPSEENLNLLLLIVLNSNQESNVAEANVEVAKQTLLALMNKPNWSDIWNQMTETYPEWGNIEIEDVIDRKRNSQINEALFSILTRFKLNKKDPLLVNVVIDALPTDQLILWLEKHELISDTDSQNIGKTLVIFDEYQKKDDSESQRILEIELRFIQFNNLVRSTLIEVIHHKKAKTGALDHDILLQRLGKVSDRVSDFYDQNNEDFVKFYASKHVVSLIELEKLSEEQFDHLLKVVEDCPSLARNKMLRDEVLSIHKTNYLSDSGRKVLKSVYDTYQGNDDLISGVIPLIDNETLKLSRVEEIAQDLINMGECARVAIANPEIILSENNGLADYKNLIAMYKENVDSLEVLYIAISEKEFTVQQARELAKGIPSIVNKGWENALEIVIKNYSFLGDSGLKFVNSLIGLHGKQSIPLVRNYIDAAKKGEMNDSDWSDIIELTKHIRILSPQTLGMYKEAKQSGTIEVFVSGLKSLADKITSGQLTSDEERNLPYYSELIIATFPNNAENFSNYQSVSSCEDRSDDIRQYKIRPRYVVDTLLVGEVTLRADAHLDENIIQNAQKPYIEAVNKAEELSFEKSKLLDWMETQIIKLASESNYDISLLENLSIEGKLYLVAANQALNESEQNIHTIKKLLMTYHLSTIDDMAIYLDGANERLDIVSNRQYAQISELNDLYINRLKDSLRTMSESALKEDEVKQQLEILFKNHSKNKSEKTDNRPKLEIENLGLSDPFIAKLQRILKLRSGRDYDTSKVVTLVQRYQKLTQSFKSDKSYSNKNLTKAFYGMLRAQRDKTLEALHEFSDDEINPEEFQLEVLTLSEINQNRELITTGEYNQQLFSKYCQQKIIDIFSQEQINVSDELQKFQSISGNTRTSLNGYITKSKESACARLTAGVCDSQDNPDKGAQNMWDMPNFFQMILQDPENYRCQGMVTMHVEVENGKNLLCISPNPCSTYLYQADERSLWKSLFAQIKIFAHENDFDMILLYSDPNLRTNRSGGEFENSMIEDVREIGEVIEFQTVRRFSYRPNYTMKKMDVLWKKEMKA